MEGFGVHTSMWTMSWDQEGCEHAVAKACSYEMDLLEIALLNPPSVDAAHSRRSGSSRNENRVFAWPP